METQLKKHSFIGLLLATIMLLGACSFKKENSKFSDGHQVVSGELVVVLSNQQAEKLLSKYNFQKKVSQNIDTFADTFQKCQTYFCLQLS